MLKKFKLEIIKNRIHKNIFIVNIGSELKYAHKKIAKMKEIHFHYTLAKIIVSKMWVNIY